MRERASLDPDMFPILLPSPSLPEHAPPELKKRWEISLKEFSESFKQQLQQQVQAKCDEIVASLPPKPKDAEVVNLKTEGDGKMEVDGANGKGAETPQVPEGHASKRQQAEDGTPVPTAIDAIAASETRKPTNNPSGGATAASSSANNAEGTIVSDDDKKLAATLLDEELAKAMAKHDGTK